MSLSQMRMDGGDKVKEEMPRPEIPYSSSESQPPPMQFPDGNT